MEIKLRAKSTFNSETVEHNITSDGLILGRSSGIQYRCDPQTLEIVIDGQAVRVATIKYLLAMRLKIKSVIDLYYDEWSNDEIAESIMKIINGQIQ